MVLFTWWAPILDFNAVTLNVHADNFLITVYLRFLVELVWSLSIIMCGLSVPTQIQRFVRI